MMMNFTPFTFIFSMLYVALLSALPSISNFIIFWLLMEIMMLLFMGTSYSCLTSSVSSIMVFFLAQTISSFLILLSYLLSSSLMLILGVVLKLGMFPLSSWFSYSVSLFPPFIFLITCTLNKLPIILLLTSFGMSLTMPSFWLLMSLNVLVSGAYMLLSTHLRSLLVMSSIANNSWFLLGQMASPSSFILFFMIYSIMLFLALSMASMSSISPKQSVSTLLLLVMTSLSGLPPSPLFMAKVYMFVELMGSPYMILFLISNSLLVCSYIVFTMKFFTWSFKKSSM